MGTNFTGSDTWVATLTGPAANDDLTAASVTDMGTQGANRTMWLSERLENSYVRRHLQRIENADTGSAYGNYGTAVTAVTWTNHSVMWVASQALNSAGDYLMLEAHLNVDCTSATWGEVRLTGDNGDNGPHARVEATTKVPVRLRHIVSNPGGGGSADPSLLVGVQLRLSDPTGDIKLYGWNRLDVWSVERVNK